jgi:hypothetical protein
MLPPWRSWSFHPTKAYKPPAAEKFRDHFLFHGLNPAEFGVLTFL